MPAMSNEFVKTLGELFDILKNESKEEIKREVMKTIEARMKLDDMDYEIDSLYRKLEALKSQKWQMSKELSEACSHKITFKSTSYKGQSSVYCKLCGYDVGESSENAESA